MRIWTPPGGGGKNRYALTAVGGSLAIGAFAAGAVSGGILLAFRLGWSMEAASLILCLLVTGAVLGLTAALGRRLLSLSLLFCMDDAGRLYAVDARKYAARRRGMASAAAVQQAVRALAAPGGILERRLREERGLTGLEPQLLRLEGLRERRGSYALRCLTRFPSGRAALRSWILVKGYEGEEELLRALVRLPGPESGAELSGGDPFPHLLLSAGALAILLALCVASHPAMGRLPLELYFPTLGLTFLAFCRVLWLLLKRYRGE